MSKFEDFKKKVSEMSEEDFGKVEIYVNTIYESLVCISDAVEPLKGTDCGIVSTIGAAFETQTEVRSADVALAKLAIAFGID